MFNKIAGHAKSVFHSSSIARLSRPAAITAAQVAPARSTRLSSAPGLTRAGEMASSVRSRSASFLPMAPTRTGATPLRDWPAASDPGEDIEDITTAGTAARRAADQAPREVAAKRETEELAFRTGIGIDPDYSASVTGISMVFGLERSAGKLLENEGPGIAAGLRELDIQPGDAVAELNPTEPGLAVRLALDGARTYLALSFPNRHREISAELQRYADGKTYPLRTRVPDADPLPAAHYHEGARKVASQLTAVKATSFRALPQDIPYKALITRGALEILDREAIEATFRDAARLLQPGGGLVFEFAHAAGTPSHPKARVKLNKIEFRQLDEAARRSGLALKCLNVRFRLAESPQVHVIPARRVPGDTEGVVDLRKADAAAWTGWNEIARLDGHPAQPVLVDVSGVFVKQAPATR